MLNALNKALEKALESANQATLLDSQKTEYSAEKSSEKDTSNSEKSSEKKSNSDSSKGNTLSTDDQIIALILSNPNISAKKISEQLALSSRTIEKHIAKLKTQHRLTRIGAAKGGYWEVNQNND